MGDHDLALGTRLGNEVDGAPVPQLGHRRSSRGLEELQRIRRRERGVGHLDQELEPAPESSFPLEHDRPLGLAPVTVGDVDRAAHGAGEATGFVARDLPTALQPANGAIGPDDAVLEVVGAPARDGGLDLGQDVVDLVRVQGVDPRLVGRPERSRRKARQRLEGGIPAHDPSRHIPTPGAGTARGESSS